MWDVDEWIWHTDRNEDVIYLTMELFAVAHNIEVRGDRRGPREQYRQVVEGYLI